VVQFAESERDLGSVRLPRWGRVVAVEGVVPWLVVDPAGEAVEPIQRFLREFVARGNRIGSVRSYVVAVVGGCRCGLGQSDFG
jgi:hypothetical protein